MRYRTVFLALGLVGLAAPAIAADPLSLYGPVATYDILRNGDPVGTHVIAFKRQGETLLVESKSDIDIDFLFMNAYAFEYRANSVWENDRLLKLDAVTDDDGDRSSLSVAPSGEALQVSGPAGDRAITPTLPVSEHWSQSFIRGGQQLNTITGEINRIEVDALGDAFVPLASGTMRADRFRISGDIQLETWYDESGRWLGMRFAANDSSVIEYRCRTCRADIATLP